MSKYDLGPPAYDPAQVGPSGTFACLMLSQTDRVRILDFSPDVTDVVRWTIRTVWPGGIQKEAPYGRGCVEFKLPGNPWSGQGLDAVPSKRLMIHLLHSLANSGWHLSASADLSKKLRDKDSLFFRSGPPVNRVVFAVTFNETDKIRLIDSPTPDIQAAFKHCVQQGWPLGIQEAKMKEKQCFQLKLSGKPWYASSGDDVVQARRLALRIMSAFDSLGYELLATIDMNTGGGKDGRDIDAWFFGAKLQF